MIKDMQNEIRLEQYNEKRKAELEVEEAAIRQSQLKQTYFVLTRHWTAYTKNILNLEQEENWARYMTCDGLPDPGSLSDMNTFLFLWSLKNEEASMSTMEEKCRVITQLLNKLDKIIRFSTIVSQDYVTECESIAAELRIKLQRWIDLACYRLLRNIEANMIRENTKTTRYVRVTDKAREYEEKLGIREKQREGRRLRLEEKKAILERMEHPPVSPRYDKRRKRGKKQRKAHSAKGEQSEFESTLTSMLPSKTELLPYLPTPNEIVREREEKARLETRKLLFIRCEKTEVNLRKYRILGGVFRVDLLYQPPQPKDLGKETSLTTLELPKEPKFVPFLRTYETPESAPDSERTPEIIEAEMKALEQAMDALVLLTLELPDSILWFEPPLVAHWLPEKRIWSTKDVHDVKFNEEKQTIAFRTGRLGIHGLAGYRDYAGVVLVVTAATVQAEFVIREDRVCLNSFTGASSTPLKGMLGEYFELECLIEVGCDLFPERDAASYLKGFSIKHPIAERHLRECMALLSTSYAFSWSRWNATRDFREIVLQFKEVHGCIAKQRTNLMLLVTPSRTMRIRCTEVSSEFSNLPLDDEDSKFYADLYQLALNTAGIKTRLLTERISYKLASTVTRLLERTNVISMSS
ncbi:Axonemal 84 kDa protein [Eufriesea mexicana]|uniref:Axonemal 84 kDa protein n=1 Tax=Eufriesea mexicana TaxID=516756 RepID=A0A310SCW7_9HYME|nr:Axonemal 84 kDa protein [Eufriesea mexicana]